MKKVIAIILLSSAVLNQAYVAPKFLTNAINQYDATLSKYATLSDQQVTFEMPECTEATYVYLRVGNRYEPDKTKWPYQRILLTPTKNKETVDLIKAPGFAIWIIPVQDVQNYIQCQQENIKSFKARGQQRENSTVFDTRQIMPETKLSNDELNKCKTKTPKEMFVTGIETYNMKKHIILPTYQEALKRQTDETARSKEYQKAHPNSEKILTLQIPEQEIKIGINFSN